MHNKSILLNPAGNIFLLCYIPIVMFFLIIDSPAKAVNENLYLVVKGPRANKSNIAGLNGFDDDPNYRIRTKETMFYPIIIEAAEKHDVDPALVKAIIKAESRYNPMATSEKGAVGLMQIMPQTVSAFSMEDMYDPVHNINAGVVYLKKLLNKFGGDLELALAAYNAGPRKVVEYQGVPPFEETMCYVKKVIKYYSYYLDA